MSGHVLVEHEAHEVSARLPEPLPCVIDVRGAQCRKLCSDLVGGRPVSQVVDDHFHRDSSSGEDLS
jgi:hypothetical protein